MFGFGLGLVSCGIYYRIYDDVINGYMSQYIFDTSNEYYVGSQLMWDMIPYVIILVGVLMLILGGLSARSQQASGGGQG